MGSTTEQRGIEESTCKHEDRTIKLSSLEKEGKKPEKQTPNLRASGTYGTIMKGQTFIT